MFPAMWAFRRDAGTMLALLVAVLAFLCVQPATAAQEERLTWYEARNESALCNDRTKAGFFLRRNNDTSNENSTKWVIYLEGGGLCYSNETCNRRFFVDTVRNEFDAQTPSDAQAYPPVGRFNPQTAWDATINRNNPRDPQTVINPLMTSLQCFRDSRSHFPNGFQISGTDILDRDSNMNQLFPDHNHVVIPYCSSDIWLGEESGGSSCNCFNFTCINFDPLSPDLQFTFRGKTIFRSIIEQLISDHGLGSATEVVLSGSSAGGVGVVNHAQWVQEQLGPTVSLLTILDSSWFINFQDSIFRLFDGTVNQADSQSQNTDRLLQLLRSHPPCMDFELGYPCCISAYCMMTRTDNATSSPLYFPSSVRAFVISSIYDVFLLVPASQQVYDESVARAADVPRSLGSTMTDSSNIGIDFVINFLRLVGEYGGAMNTTLIQTATQIPNLSFYLPQCVQHIYLATSSLWGPTGSSVFGSSAVDLNFEGVVEFGHNISSGRWTSNLLAVDPTSSNTDITMHDALLEWYTEQNTSSNRPYQYRANCQGPYCYSVCPDQIILGELTANSWPDWSKIVIAIIIVSIAIICLFIKILFVIWLYVLEKKQDAYLDSLEDDLEYTDGSLKFPSCEDEDAVSVSCLDVHYSVTFKAKKAVKDEKKDQTAPVVLNDIAESSSSEEDLPEDYNPFANNGSSTRRSSRATRRKSSVRRKSQLPLHVPQLSTFRSRRPSAADKRQRFSNKTSDPPKTFLPLRKPSNQNFSDDSQVAIMPESIEERKIFGYHKKEILKGISIYFNPGEMIGVMGPSGCGKTTFLDLMTGRRKTGNFTGEIYVNGIPMDEIRDWYITNTGYVLQLATPYYEELTVRENITLAAQLKLPKTFTLREKFERVEQVMEVTGLTKLAETVVGGATGPGLSGGQKRRLAIALQLLKLPSVIFLDEPTSGLDATSSFELLTHLNKLADSNRTVILTIHQPRLEIFHMFDRLVLLSDGRVAYHGAPEKAYEVFVNALTSRFLEQGLVIPELENHNPADVIMDMLGNQKMRQIITEHYHMSAEPRLVRRAITAARWREYSTSTSSMDTISSSVSFAIFGAKKVSRRQPGLFTRMATLEARGSKRAFNFFLPFMFFAFGFVLGTVYLQQTVPLLIISGVCVFSVASGLFMFPAMYPYYQRALEVYTYERADGVGRSVDLVLQGFIRFISISILPVILSATILYLMLVNARSYDIIVYLQVVLVNIALNQTWVAMLIALICALPNSAFRVSSGISAVAGFTSGFFIPVEQLGWWWRWLVYINPNYYAVSSVAVFVLSDFQTDCPGSEFGCFLQSGIQVLRQFNFDKVNPYLHLAIILGFTILYMILAVFANWVRHTSVGSKLKRLKAILSRSSGDSLSKEFDKNRDQFERSFSAEMSLEGEDPANFGQTAPLSPIREGDEEEEGSQVAMTPHSKARDNWKMFAGKSLDQLEEGPIPQQQETSFQEVPTPEGANNKTSGWAKVKRVRISDDTPERPTKIPLKPGSPPDEKSVYLREGDSHRVWRPKKAPQLAELVSDLIKKEKQKSSEVSPQVVTETPSPPKHPAITPTGASRGNLRARQKTLFNRVRATQAVLRETTGELLNEEDEDVASKPHISLFEASKKITNNIKLQRSFEEEKKGDVFSSVVSKYLSKMKSEEGSFEASSPSEPQPSPEGPRNARKTRRGSKRNTGAIPLTKWKHLAREHKKKGGWVGGALSNTKKSSTEYPLQNLPEIEETDQGIIGSNHKPLGRSVSDTYVAEDQKSNQGTTFGVTLVEQRPSASSSSQINVTMSDSSPTTPPVHQPIMKKDSHGIIKQSKLAQLKQGKGAGPRRGSSGLPRQNPIDVESSLTPVQRPEDVRRSASPGDQSRPRSQSPREKKVSLDDPPKSKRRGSKDRGHSPASSIGEPHSTIL